MLFSSKTGDRVAYLPENKLYSSSSTMSSDQLRELGLKQAQAQELALAEARKKAIDAAKASGYKDIDQANAGTLLGLSLSSNAWPGKETGGGPLTFKEVTLASEKSY